MSHLLSSTLLLRGGHRWVCAPADAQAVLAHLSDPHPDPHKMFVLRGADGASLTIPAREIVGVVGGERTSPVVPTAQQVPFQAMRKEGALKGSPVAWIDDFLSPADLEKLLNYALAQEAVYVGATVTDTVADYRSAKVLFDVSPIADLFVPRIRALAPLALSLLDMRPEAIKTIECQLTAHGAGDYFKRHNDNGSPETAARCLSYVYYFHREPKGFAGGLLRMYETAVENGFYVSGVTHLDFEPRRNSLILFPSYCQHEVTPVQCPSGCFADRRFTVNGWVVKQA